MGRYLSQRACQWLETDFCLLEGARLAMASPFDLKHSPLGCINLGTAENDLMLEELQVKVK